MLSETSGSKFSFGFRPVLGVEWWMGGLAGAVTEDLDDELKFGRDEGEEEGEKEKEQIHFDRLSN